MLKKFLAVLAGVILTMSVGITTISANSTDFQTEGVATRVTNPMTKDETQPLILKANSTSKRYYHNHTGYTCYKITSKMSASKVK